MGSCCCFVVAEVTCLCLCFQFIQSFLEIRLKRPFCHIHFLPSLFKYVPFHKNLFSFSFSFSFSFFGWINPFLMFNLPNTFLWPCTKNQSMFQNSKYRESYEKATHQQAETSDCCKRSGH
jgi:hypothetical protein